MRNRSHISFRREATFEAKPHQLALGGTVVDPARAPHVRREDLGAGCYVLHGVLTAAECRGLVAAARDIGFTHVFDHLLLHEGAEVTRGVKYAVRSDLIYR